MAEVKIDFLLTPERIKLEDASLRRNSTGKTSTSNSGEKNVPHYLRASTSSCHDFCKYGRKHTFEAKARSRVLKGTKSVSSDKHDTTESITEAGRHKKTICKLKPSPNSRAHLPDVPKIIKREVPTPSKKPHISTKQNLSPSKKSAAPDVPRIIKREVSTPPKKASISTKQILSASKEMAAPDVTRTIKREVPTPPKRGHISGKNILLPSKETDATDMPIIVVKREVSKPANKSYIPPKHILSPSKKTEASAKHVTTSKLKLKAKESTSSPFSSPGVLGGRKSSSIMVTNNNGTSKISEKKLLAGTKASLILKPSVARVASFDARKRKNLKVAPLKILNKEIKAEPKQPSDEKVQEKTLYIIEPTEKKNMEPAQIGSVTTQLDPSSVSSSMPSSPKTSLSLPLHDEEENEESGSALSETTASITEHDETESESQDETLEMEHKGMPRMGAIVHSDGEDCSPHKLNFRRGKVIDPHSENNNPRKLRFRRGRVLGENQNGKGDEGRRSFRRRREMGNGESNGTKDGSEKVVLKHQDLQGKKDAQGLFNNVIEETASKLVETRKSKVKALVGAFETVISLQESKPSTTTAS